MSSPRPDINEIKEIVESETKLEWFIKKDEPDVLSLYASKYKLDIVWCGKNWTFEFYDFESEFGEEEPKSAQGPMYDAEEIKKELPSFIRGCV